MSICFFFAVPEELRPLRRSLFVESVLLVCEALAGESLKSKSAIGHTGRNCWISWGPDLTDRTLAIISDTVLVLRQYRSRWLDDCEAQ